MAWLRPHVSTAGSMGSIPCLDPREPRSRMPHGTAKKEKMALNDLCLLVCMPLNDPLSYSIEMTWVTSRTLCKWWCVTSKARTYQTPGSHPTFTGITCSGGSWWPYCEAAQAACWRRLYGDELRPPAHLGNGVSSPVTPPGDCNLMKNPWTCSQIPGLEKLCEIRSVYCLIKFRALNITPR